VLADVRARVIRLPIVRQARFAQLRRMRPIANGRQRGVPIVRHYWAQFLDTHQEDIRGHALEIGTTETIRRYGGSRLTAADAIDLAAHHSEITVVADLTKADAVPSNTYDCFVNQFTMHLIYDLESALYHSLRLLKPGGVLLANFPSVEYCFARGLDMGTGGPLFVFWQFTPLQVENLFRRAGLEATDYELEIFGNLFTRIAYQMNMPAEELTRTELDHVDLGHPLLICTRVVKPPEWNVPRPTPRAPWMPAVTPARWNSVTGHYAA
jgi:SAM-dependent methyltransferase